MVRARIAGTGRATPDKVLTNDDLSKMVATSDQWINESTGIRERRILEEGRTTSDLASLAGRRACETAEIDPLGNVTQREYDAFGNVVGVTRSATPLASSAVCG